MYASTRVEFRGVAPHEYVSLFLRLFVGNLLAFLDWIQMCDHQISRPALSALSPGSPSQTVFGSRVLLSVE